MPQYKLYYFNFRGRAEVIRLVFAAAGQAYEDIRLTKEEWQKEKPRMPFGQLPVLEIDGVLVSQSNAIARLIAKSVGLSGKDDIESCRCDMVVDCMDDLGKPLMDIFFCKEEDKKTEMKKKYSEQTLPDFLKRFEKLLVSNNGGDGYFVGNKLTWADLAWLHGILWIPLMGIEIPWDMIPKQKALPDRIETLPKIKEWYEKRPKTDM